MDADELLQALGLLMGLPKLRFDSNGCARLSIDGAPALNFERSEAGGIHMYSVLSPLPPDGREALYTRLLKANLFGTATKGATLAVDVAHNEVVICRTFPTELATAASFHAMVEGFVDAADEWEGRLAGAQADAEPRGLSHLPASMREHFVRG
jgi:hypothetical protein